MTSSRSPAATRPALGVSELLALARARLEADFAGLWVQGEVSSLKHAPSGHVYFNLKDAQAQIRVVLFRSRAYLVRFRLAEGLAVLVRGGLTVYDARGDLQLQAVAVEPFGLGALTLALEQLRARLAAEGLFDAGRKRPLPPHPRRVGIVTSLAGAALRDMLQVLSRRQRGLRVLISPARVQGEGAAIEIGQAIDALGHFEDVDVIVVGRGGGSAEDLRAFNEEAVVRAIAAAPVPVISAVGHEVDVTLADLAADLRAPTPSAAAELVARSSAESLGQVVELGRRLRAALRAGLATRRVTLGRLAASRALRTVETLPGRHLQRLDDLRARLERAARRTLQRRRELLARLAHDLGRLDVRLLLRLHRQRLAAARLLLGGRMAGRLLALRGLTAALAGRLDDLSPLAVLGRGYAIASIETGLILRSSQDVAAGDRIAVRLFEGSLVCRIEERR